MNRNDNDRLEAKNPKLLATIESVPDLCIALAKNEDALEKLLNKIQTSLVGEGNKDELGHTIFAMRQIQGVLDSAIIFGKAVIAKAEQAKKENKKK